MDYLSNEAATRVEAALRSRGPGALGDYLRPLEHARFSTFSESEIDQALVACELSAALAGRPAPALSGHPGLRSWVDEFLSRMPPFGPAQLSLPHAVARTIRSHDHSGIRGRPDSEDDESEWDDQLDELIERLNPSPSTLTPWWEMIDAVTVTAVSGLGAREVVSRLGGDPRSGFALRFREVWADHPYDGVHLAAQIDELEGQTTVVEPNGWLMSTDSVAAEVSRGSSLISVYWNVNSLMRVVVAVDGRIVRGFDPLLYDHPSLGDPLPEEHDLAFGVPGACRLATITLLQRLSGLTWTTEWLLELPHPTWYGLRISTD